MRNEEVNMALQQRPHANAGDETVSQRILIPMEMPADLVKFKLPKGVDERLHYLLDRQDQGEELTTAERLEAEGLVNLAELLSLLRLRVERAAQEL
jgi:hypothetical protein